MLKKKANLNRIAVVLAELDIFQRDLAAGVNLGEVTISRYCNNQRQPSLEILNDIANYLKVDVRRLLVPNKYGQPDPAKK
jgi:transcriptional regulator with XRE-family HTH domain